MKLPIHLDGEINLTVRLAGVDALLEVVPALFRKMEQIMATVQEVKDAVAAEAAEVKTRLDALESQVTDLQAQVAAGSAATPAQLDELLAAVQGIFVPAAA